MMVRGIRSTRLDIVDITDIIDIKYLETPCARTPSAVGTRQARTPWPASWCGSAPPPPRPRCRAPADSRKYFMEPWKYFILTWKPRAEARRTVATFVLAFILSPIPFLDIADSDLPKKLYCEARGMVLWIEDTHTPTTTYFRFLNFRYRIYL